MRLLDYRPYIHPFKTIKDIVQSQDIFHSHSIYSLHYIYISKILGEQYTCRKTLADSRPRIRGRFARNDETEKTNYSSADLQSSQMTSEEADDEDYEHWIYLLHSMSSHVVP